LEGIVALARQPDLGLKNLKLGQNSLLVIVEGVEKPGNLGAILRTCDAAGVDGLIVCDGRTDVYNPNVIRASLGAVFTVPVVACENQQALDFLRSHQIRVIGTFPDSKKSYLKADYSVPAAILLGSEQEGLSPFWRENADDQVLITMSGKVNSLNVSISAAIVIYEALRQRMAKPFQPPGLGRFI
jgi:RNA methyltransferase, TrmH family